MFTSLLVSLAAISTLVGSASAAFQILSPGGPNLWWVAQSENVISWSCHDNPPASTSNAYQLLVNNTNPTILTAAQAIVANVPNADCAHIIGVQQASLTPATGYTLIFADIIDQRKVYAVSQPFEVKALGATYPSTSATPTDDPTAATSGASATSTGTGTSSGSASTNTSRPNGASTTFEVSAAGVLAAVGAAIGML
ncbi:hypothetical protein BC826DRAFT_360539 [Russula brevipes]|nr:hypothetical protein BC826DRAFT_360539 [Russula brevipes]